jgi:hypothetical protein
MKTASSAARSGSLSSRRSCPEYCSFSTCACAGEGRSRGGKAWCGVVWCGGAALGACVCGGIYVGGGWGSGSSAWLEERGELGRSKGGTPWLKGNQKQGRAGRGGAGRGRLGQGEALLTKRAYAF